MLVVIGGGPAGFFGAIQAKKQNPTCPVLLLEKSRQGLRKVLVSGGGRCNVTHACFEPRELITRYPRGGRELRGPFHTFGPAETVAWFAEQGVPLKTEPDGRMFPVTDSSRTIVECLQQAAQSAGVEVRNGVRVTGLSRAEGGLAVAVAGEEPLAAGAVLLATGGQTSGDGSSGYELAAKLGHSILSPVPSLFTLKINDPLLDGLAGVAVGEATIRVVANRKLTETGPVLITHWGLSGPAVLRLSAWGAREFSELEYHTEVAVDWVPGHSAAQVDEQLQAATRQHGKQQIHGNGLFGLPRRLWQSLATASGIEPATRWADLARDARRDLARRVGDTRLVVSGQALNKEEFVTCGGVNLKEVNFKTMASRVCPDLYLAGEVLNVDGLTGGYNFQACWTTGWLAGSAAARNGLVG